MTSTVTPDRDAAPVAVQYSLPRPPVDRWTEVPVVARRLPAELGDVVGHYRTAELATVSRSGAPVAWPVVTWLDPADGRLVVTTSVAFGAKLRHLRRDARVSLLWSDRTGSDRDDLPQVLVQGTASVDDGLHVDPAGLADYWRRLYRLQPSGTSYFRGPLRGAFDWYFFRAAIRVSPGRARTAPPAAAANADGPRPSRRDRSPSSALARELPHYGSSVLSWVDEIGLPWTVRVGMEPVGSAFRVLGADGAPLREGPAGMLAHRHDELVDHQRTAGALGNLRHDGSSWWFDVAITLPGITNDPLTVLRLVRRARAAAAAWVERSGQPRPRVPWDAYARLAAEARALGPVV